MNYYQVVISELNRTYGTRKTSILIFTDYINEVNKYIEKYENDLIVIKYGGNVLIDRDIFNNFIIDLSILNKLGLSVIVVHGGGPRIKRELDKSNIQSKFIRGLRVTDEKIIDIVESVLIDFNNDIVSSLKRKNTEGITLHPQPNHQKASSSGSSERSSMCDENKGSPCALKNASSRFQDKLENFLLAAL